MRFRVWSLVGVPGSGLRFFIFGLTQPIEPQLATFQKGQDPFMGCSC